MSCFLWDKISNEENVQMGPNVSGLMVRILAPNLVVRFKINLEKLVYLLARKDY